MAHSSVAAVQQLQGAGLIEDPDDDSTWYSAYGREKEDAMRVGCNFKKENPKNDTLQFELATSYYWSGNYCKDYLFFICNWHPFIGICLSHPVHPWSKCERIWSLFISLSLTLLPTAILAQYLGTAAGSQMTHVAILCFVTLPVMVIEIGMYWLSVLDIYGKVADKTVARFKIPCIKCAKCCKTLRNLYFCFWTFVSLIVIACSVAYVMKEGDTSGCSTNSNLKDSLKALNMSDYVGATCRNCPPPLICGVPAEEGCAKCNGGMPVMDLIAPLLISRMQSYLFWFPLFFLNPCIGFHCVWRGEQRKMAKKTNNKRSLSFSDSENESAEASGDDSDDSEESCALCR